MMWRCVRFVIRPGALQDYHKLWEDKIVSVNRAFGCSAAYSLA